MPGRLVTRQPRPKPPPPPPACEDHRKAPSPPPPSRGGNHEIRTQPIREPPSQFSPLGYRSSGARPSPSACSTLTGARSLSDQGVNGKANPGQRGGALIRGKRAIEPAPVGLHFRSRPVPRSPSSRERKPLELGAFRVQKSTCARGGHGMTTRRLRYAAIVNTVLMGRRDPRGAFVPARATQTYGG